MTAPKTKPGAAQTDRAQEQVDRCIVADRGFSDKKLAGIAAQLALRGFAQHKLECGGYLIARWDRTTYCHDIQCCDAFLERVS